MLKCQGWSEWAQGNDHAGPCLGRNCAHGETLVRMGLVLVGSPWLTSTSRSQLEGSLVTETGWYDFCPKEKEPRLLLVPPHSSLLASPTPLSKAGKTQA